jgi:hypothetical protein
MKLRFALTALCALLAATGTAAAKETPVGQIVAVTGNVSVGGDSFISKATAGTSLHAGNTVLVSSNGKATITVGQGCVIQLGASQHLRITPSLKCEQQQASVKQMFAAYQVAQAPVPVTPLGYQGHARVMQLGHSGSVKLGGIKRSNTHPSPEHKGITPTCCSPSTPNRPHHHRAGNQAPNP